MIDDYDLLPDFPCSFTGDSIAVRFCSPVHVPAHDFFFFPQFKHCDVLAQQVQSIAARLLNCLCIISAIFLPYKKKKSIKPRAWIRPCGGHPGKACPWGSWDINTIYLGSWLSRNYFDWLQGHGKGLSNCFIWTLFMKDKRSRVTRGTCGFTSWKQHLPIDICEGSGPSGAVLQAKFKSAAASFVFQS